MPYPLYWPKHGMPHGYVCAIPVHLVYRLDGCLPVGVLRALAKDLSDDLRVLRARPSPNLTRIEEVKDEYFRRYDDLLDAQDQTKYILADPAAAQLVIDSWRFLNERRACRVIAVCVMGNHVHVILVAWPAAEMRQLGRLVKAHKSFTGNAMDVAGLHARTLTSKVWASGFFDRYVRPGQLDVVLAYVLDNPTKAGLVARAADWPHTWVAPEYSGLIH